VPKVVDAYRFLSCRGAKDIMHQYAGIAQLVEQLIRNQ
jgi:hypothetical protein